MTTEYLLTTADALLALPVWRPTTDLDLNVMEIAIFDQVRVLAHRIEGLAAKYQGGDAAIQACNIADLLRMQSRIATRRDEIRRAAS